MRSVSLFAVAVLAVLVVAMPASAFNGGLILDPASGCPGTAVLVFLEDGPLPVDDGGPLMLSSEPDGLMSNYDCAVLASYQGGSGGLAIASYQATQDQQLPPICRFRVSGSANCGQYVVILQYGQETIGAADFKMLCACAAVGGCVEPANMFAMVSPWLAVIGLVGCIGTAVVVAKRRR